MHLMASREPPCPCQRRHPRELRARGRNRAHTRGSARQVGCCSRTWPIDFRRWLRQRCVYRASSKQDTLCAQLSTRPRRVRLRDSSTSVKTREIVSRLLRSYQLKPPEMLIWIEIAFDANIDEDSQNSAWPTARSPREPRPSRSSMVISPSSMYWRAVTEF
jgi:hypothetical protein